MTSGAHAGDLEAAAEEAATAFEESPAVQAGPAETPVAGELDVTIETAADEAAEVAEEAGEATEQ
ncbi:MAG: hypothetical protein CL908_04200 [Deltaproteobacteria bacterium]|nr:hypothetical protein [Deltaproteobacteria bacterium]